MSHEDWRNIFGVHVNVKSGKKVYGRRRIMRMKYIFGTNKPIVTQVIDQEKK